MTGNVFRVNKSRDYTVMSNHHLRNRELSLKAKGLLSLMLSLPDEWDYSVAGLVSIVPDGKAAVGSALREIEAHGYLQRTQVRGDHGEMGGMIYEIHETPWFSPQTDFPSAEKPSAENQPQLNTKEINTNSINTTPIQDREKELVSTPMRVSSARARKSNGKFIPPTIEEVKAYCIERGNSVNPEKWYDHYSSNGWMVGRSKMKEWQAAIRNWEHNGIDTAPSKPKRGNDELLNLIRSGAFDESDEEVAYIRQMERETAERMERARAFMQGRKT